MLEDSIIKDGSFQYRLRCGRSCDIWWKDRFASDQIQLDGLKQSAIAARGIAKQGQKRQGTSLQAQF